MDNGQEEYLSLIDRLKDDEIFIRKTGWKEVNLSRHVHGRHQVMYTLSGTLRVQIGDTAYFVPEKHIVWIPENTEHELSSNNRQSSLVVFYFTFKSLLAEDNVGRFSIFNVNPVMAENIKFIDSFGNFIRKSVQPDLFFFALGFFKLLPAMNPHKEILLKTLVIPRDFRLQPVLYYIIEHAHENLSIDQVASEFGFSVRNLSRLLHNSGIRFSNYLNYQRITRAIELFSDKGKTIQQIAYEVGFSTPNHFNRVFRQITGMAPGAFGSRGD